MKRFFLSMIAVAAVAGTLLMTACDWSSGSQSSFNTSGGSLSNTNISGFYSATGGGKMVRGNSRGNIVSMTIQQSGNRVDVVDNQGSRYTGTVGAPAVLATPSGGAVPVGAALAAFQISFSGRDGVAARDIEFSGTINVVAVNDIVGNTSTTTNNSTDTDDSTTTTSTDPLVVTNVVTGVVTTTTTTTTNTNTDETVVEETTTVEYELTGANTQLRLRGTWVEVGGAVASVDGLAAGVNANLSTITTTTGDGGGTP